tara:strand:- start:1766 stop:1936 length:171 start_codon:yes stop_codon:yes gene_type:complete
MDEFEFDDTQTSGIWWSTNLAINDACVELKAETNCSDKRIIDLLKKIIANIESNGI